VALITFELDLTEEGPKDVFDIEDLID